MAYSETRLATSSMFGDRSTVDVNRWMSLTLVRADLAFFVMQIVVTPFHWASSVAATTWRVWPVCEMAMATSPGRKLAALNIWMSGSMLAVQS